MHPGLTRARAASPQPSADTSLVQRPAPTRAHNRPTRHASASGRRAPIANPRLRAAYRGVFVLAFSRSSVPARRTKEYYPCYISTDLKVKAAVK